MKENDLRYNIGELASASPSSRIDDELAEKKKLQRKSLVKMGTMGILALILLVFSSMHAPIIQMTV